MCDCTEKYINHTTKNKQEMCCACVGLYELSEILSMHCYPVTMNFFSGPRLPLRKQKLVNILFQAKRGRRPSGVSGIRLGKVKINTKKRGTTTTMTTKTYILFTPTRKKTMLNKFRPSGKFPKILFPFFFQHKVQTKLTCVIF